MPEAFQRSPPHATHESRAQTSSPRDEVLTSDRDGFEPSRPLETMMAIGASVTMVCDDDAILDHQFDRAHMVDVIERVSPHRDQVRQLARLDGAKPVAHPAQLRSVFRRRQEGLPRGGSGLDPQLHLLMYG